MSTARNTGSSILVCMTESDAHVVAIKLLEIFLREKGWEVNNLGVCTPLQECMQVAASTDPLAIVIGTQNGHALTDLAHLRDVLEQYQVDAPVLVGGNLSLGARQSIDVEAELIRLGVTRTMASFEMLDDYLRNFSSSVNHQWRHAS